MDLYCVCGGSFLTMAGDVAGVGQLPLIRDGDITTGHQEFMSCSLSSVCDLEKTQPSSRGRS